KRKAVHDEQARTSQELRVIAREAEREKIAVAAPVVPAPAQAPAQAPVIEAPAPPKLDKRKEDAERSTAIAASLAAMCDDMEKLAEAKDGRAIDRLLQQAARSFEQLGKVIGAERETLGDRYSAARGKLVVRAK